MQAVILAAGMGKRLKELTAGNTKCMIKVNGVSLIERMLSQLDRLNLTRIVLVIGYEGKKLMEFVRTLPLHTPLEFVDNPIYAKTNNIYSLYLAGKYLEKEDTLLLESDLIFDDSLLGYLLEAPAPSLALVAKFESWMDGTVVTLDADSHITSFRSKKEFVFEDIPKYYKTVNIYKFSRDFSQKSYLPFLEAYCKVLGANEYYEQVLKVIVQLKTEEIKALPLQENMLWYEIDDIQDLDIAESIFADSTTRYTRISARYGGYWRYSHLTDFCYLVNPGFPNAHLMAELKANFEPLLCNYPSGQQVNSLLAGKYFAVSGAWIAVGNGAAEEIKALMAMLPGRKGVTIPTFEEYSHRCSESELVCFTPNNRDFRYQANDLIRFFSEHPVETLVLINPDNPSGNCIDAAGLEKLAAWTKTAGMKLVIDESFADFATEKITLIRRNFLEVNPHVVVVKSISKSFGVPGIRLGVTACSDEAFMEALKKELSIWNINSFGEFFLQIIEKYKDDYEQSLVLLRSLRAKLFHDLAAIPGIRPISSEANYITFELSTGIDSGALAEHLLAEHDLLVKNLNTKNGIHGNYIRVAVKDDSQNQKLIRALTECVAIATK